MVLTVILPTKGITPDRSLIAIGSFVLVSLKSERSVVQLWQEYNEKHSSSYVSYDWFCLATSFLYSLGLVELVRGQLRRVR